MPVGLFGFLDVPGNHLLLGFFGYVSLAAPLVANDLVCDLVVLLGDWLDLLAFELTVLLNYLLVLVVLVFEDVCRAPHRSGPFVMSPVEVGSGRGAFRPCHGELGGKCCRGLSRGMRLVLWVGGGGWCWWCLVGWPPLLPLLAAGLCGGCGGGPCRRYDS